MWELNACTVCFKTEGKLYKLIEDSLEKLFLLVSGLKASDRVGCPQFLCVECSAYVRKFIKFRDKCQRAHFALKEILHKRKEVTLFTLNSINREAIDNQPSLSYLDLKNSHSKEIQFRWVRNNRLSCNVNYKIPVFHCNVSVHKDYIDTTKKLKQPVKNEEDNRCTIEVDLSKNFYNDTSNSLELNKLCALLEEPAAEQPQNYNENDDGYDNDWDNQEADDTLQTVDGQVKQENKNTPDGSNLNEEYALMVPIAEQEAKAAAEVMKMYGKSRTGDVVCEVCEKTYRCEKQYKVHKRMHDTHISGNFYCSICQYYYKTNFMLKIHMTDKHMYKYLCRKCPEVNFDRPTAKKHYISSHMPKYQGVVEVKREWMKRGGRRTKGISTPRLVNPNSNKRSRMLPDDFLTYTPVTHEQQYEIVQERKNTSNYLDSVHKCELCFKGFRELQTYENHMKKHTPHISGNYQCDICKLFFLNTRKMYKHMIITHLFKYSCQMCNYTCYNKGQAHTHYKWHKDVTYKCPHCDKEFKKASTQLTHIRLKHPSSFLCNICGHSYVSETGLYFHKKLKHTDEEIQESESLAVDTSDVQYCAECDVQFMSYAAYKTHLSSSSKHTATNIAGKPSRAGKNYSQGRKKPGLSTGKPRGRPRNGSSDIVNTGIPVSSNCELCNVFLSNDVQARKHYEAEHPGHEPGKRYMCDVCGHTTRQYANLLVHMRTHTNEKPYECPHCNRRFSMPSNRDRHLVVHTGEKRYQCHHCNRRFTQSSAVKLHIQTVHLKIPYAPWNKKNRKRRKEMESAGSTGSELAATTAAHCLPPQHKILIDSQADYLNAYITYNE